MRQWDSSLYDLSLTWLTGKEPGSSGPNPLGSEKNGSNFELLNKEVARDHKRSVYYTPLSFLLVKAGERPIDNPQTGTELEPREHLIAWLEARKMGVFPMGDCVPYLALKAAAVEQDIVDWDDMIEDKIVPVYITDWYEFGERYIHPEEALPYEAHVQILDQFQDEYGVTPNSPRPIHKSHFKSESLETGTSIATFVGLFFTSTPRDNSPFTDENGNSEARERTKPVWKFYRKWCEFNGVEPVSQFNGGKKEIARVTRDMRRVAHDTEGFGRAASGSVDMDLSLEKTKLKWELKQPSNVDHARQYRGGRIRKRGRWLASHFGVEFDKY